MRRGPNSEGGPVGFSTPYRANGARLCPGGSARLSTRRRRRAEGGHAAARGLRARSVAPWPRRATRPEVRGAPARVASLERPAASGDRPGRGSVAVARAGPGRASAALPRGRARQACLRATAPPCRSAWAIGRRTAGPAAGAFMGDGISGSPAAFRRPTEPPKGGAAGSHAASGGSVPVLRRSRSARPAAGVTAGHRTCDSRRARLARQPLRRGVAIGAAPTRMPAKTPEAAAADPTAQPARGSGDPEAERTRTAEPRRVPSRRSGASESRPVAYRRPPPPRPPPPRPPP